MENQKIIYEFPCKDKFRVRELTEPDFDIKDYPLLYVDLQEIRSQEHIDKFEYQLGIENDELKSKVENFVKIVFSGYRGSGKTLELRKFQQKVNQPKQYLSIMIEIEDEFHIDKFRPEDFFVLIITKLVERLYEEKIDYSSRSLLEIQEEWLSEKDILKEVSDKSSYSTELEAGSGFKFWKLLDLSAKLKSAFGNETKVAETIRRKVINNNVALIERLNVALLDIREALKNYPDKAQDILFIFDGSEKLRTETYEDLFIRGANLINRLQLNLITSVPLYTFYNIHHDPAMDSYYEILLPMIKISSKSIPLLKEIITRRIDEKIFFEKGILDEIAKKSGGSIRQMLKIVNEALNDTLGKRITKDNFEKSLTKIANKMYEGLRSNEKDVLMEKKYIDKNGKPNIADAEIWNLVFTLILFKYNGDIEINPLIKDMFAQNS